MLMTGGGAPGAPGILRCLKQISNIQITLADANPNAVGKFLNQSFESIPLAGDGNFIEDVLKLSLSLKVTHILPLVTRELFKFSSAKNRFIEAGIHVLVSDPEPLNIANDKGLTYLTLEKLGISVPAFRIIHSIADLKTAALELGYPNKKLAIKPCVSNGSRGFRILQAQDKDAAKRFFTEKPTASSQTVEEIAEMLKDYPIPPMLLSEFLPGDEYSIDTVVKDGKCLITLPRKRTEIRAGISVRGEFEQNQEIISYCEAIASGLKLEGNIGLQVKADENGNYRLLEINPRVQGTIVSALGAGVNLPAIAINGKAPDPSIIDWDTKFVRYYEEVFYR